MGRFDGFTVDYLTAAAHEAGHVLAALSAGFEIAAVEIFPENGGVGGITHLVRTDFEEDEHDDVRVGLWAGREAETHWIACYGAACGFDRNPRDYVNGGCGSDMDEFARMCRRGQGSLSRRESRTRARCLITRHWARVDRFTLRLARIRRITTI